MFFARTALPRAVLFLIAAVYCASGRCQAPSDPLAGPRSLAEQGKLAGAEAEVEAYLKGNAESADAHFLLGYILFRESKGRESLAEFTAGAKFRRPSANELKIIASDYILLDDFVDADKWFTEAVTESPSDANGHYLLGRTKFNENDYRGAIASFERAIELHPKYVEAENNIGLAWRELSDPEKARAAFETAIEWQGTNPADAQPFLNLGKLYGDQHQPDKAISYLNRAADLAPTNPTVHEELSHVYAAQQDLPKAQFELEKAIALAPNISSLHYQLGQIYRRQGQTAKAQHEFDLTAKLSGSHSSEKTPNPFSIKPTDHP